MKNEYISIGEAADILGVEPRSMARWRLHENQDKTWFLPAYPHPKDKRKMLYKTGDLIEFANRNPRYRDRILGWYARDQLGSPTSHGKGPCQSTTRHHTPTSTTYQLEQHS